MSLYEINSTDIVKKQTITTIQSSDYLILRQAIFDKKPLERVVNQVDTLLKEQTTKDKEAYKRTTTADACQKQLSDDLKEQTQDSTQASQDQELKSILTLNIQQLSSEIECLNKRLNDQNTLYNTLDTEIAILKNSKSHIDEQLSKNSEQRRLITSQCSSPTNVHGHNSHTHGHDSHVHGREDHVHGHDDLIHQPTASVLVYSPFAQSELNRLAILEAELTSQQLAFSTDIQLKTQRKNAEYDTLHSIKRDINSKEGELNRANTQLHSDIPSRERQRTNRDGERKNREQARLNEDSNLLQLSTSSRKELASDITDRFRQYDNKRDALFNEATQLSYPTFMEQLESQLTNPTASLMINQPEVAALLLIIQYTKEYLTMQAEALRLNQNVSRLQSTLKQQNQELNAAVLKSEQYNQSNPQLNLRNDYLAQCNVELAQHAESNRRTANILFTISGISGATALGGGLLIGLMIMNPLFFIIPGIVALVAVATLITAIVYKYKESDNTEQLSQNITNINANTRQISQQTSELTTLSNTTIPQLETDIAATGQHISEAETQVASHQLRMQLQQAKIENVTVTPVSQGGFYTLNVSVDVNGPVLTNSTENTSPRI